jgi:hypothetical protein
VLDVGEDGVGGGEQDGDILQSTRREGVTLAPEGLDDGRAVCHFWVHAHHQRGEDVVVNLVIPDRAVRHLVGVG